PRLHAGLREGDDGEAVAARGRAKARGLREETRGEHQEPLVAGDAVRGAGVPLFRADRRAQYRADGPDVRYREDAQGPARRTRHHGEGEGIPAPRAGPREIPRARPLRSGDWRAKAREPRTAAVDQGVRRRG